ncbi:MAG: gluconate 2-dehydrogenase subunit 3 family protein [Bradymonadia bacterium]
MLIADRHGAIKSLQPAVPRRQLGLDMSDTRRSFIKKGLFGGALLTATGAGWLAYKPTRTVPLPAEGLIVLDQETYSILHAFTGRVLTDPTPSPVARAQVPLQIDRTLAAMDAQSREDFVKTLKLLESALLGFVLDFRWTPFTQLDTEDQDDVLDAWRTSLWTVRRSGYQVIKQMITRTYYANPLTYGAIDYPGPPRHLLP